MFAALTPSATAQERRSMALRGTLVAAAILGLFALLGERLLRGMGITLPALQTAGGILLLLISIDMVFARTSGGTSTTEAENREAAAKDDIAVFPLAMPLIAGPGTLGAVVLLLASAGEDLAERLVVIASLAAMLGVTLACLLGASLVQRLFGITGMHVISRVFGVLLAALAVQFLFDGVRGSGLLSGAGG
jgi:multiple antibiotic resistance protein